VPDERGFVAAPYLGVAVVLPGDNVFGGGAERARAGSFVLVPQVPRVADLQDGGIDGATGGQGQRGDVGPVQPVVGREVLDRAVAGPGCEDAVHVGDEHVELVTGPAAAGDAVASLPEDRGGPPGDVVLDRLTERLPSVAILDRAFDDSDIGPVQAVGRGRDADRAAVHPIDALGVHKAGAALSVVHPVLALVALAREPDDGGIRCSVPDGVVVERGGSLLNGDPRSLCSAGGRLVLCERGERGQKDGQCDRDLHHHRMLPVQYK